MILIEKFECTIKLPSAPDSLEHKKYLYENLKNGLCVFKIPNDYNKILIDAKKHKKNYKVGFLYDLLTDIYPNLGKEEKHEIISEQYNLWFTYRQFKNLLDEYQSKKLSYLNEPQRL